MEGLDRVGGVNASPYGLWETVEGKQPRLTEVFEEQRLRRRPLFDEQAKPPLRLGPVDGRIDLGESV